jgi:hypothetical protein
MILFMQRGHGTAISGKLIRFEFDYGKIGAADSSTRKSKGGGPGLPASLFLLAENPADLTEGGQPVVCWPKY